MNNFQSFHCDSIHSCHVASYRLSDCAHFNVNNPPLGICGSNRGNSNAPYNTNVCSYNGEQNVDLNSNYFDNQIRVVVASQHNGHLVREVQPHHQCTYSNYYTNSTGFTTTRPFIWCGVMFTNQYWENTATLGTRHLVFILDAGKF